MSLIKEETEVKKDKKWAQKEVDRYLSYEGVNEARNALTFAKGVINQLDEPEVKQLERKIKELDSYNDELIRDNNQFRNELDNQEVLSQEWIDDNKEMYLINDTSENAVPDYKLRNLLMPKQEEPTQEQVQKYLSEHGIEVVENEPETVADVISDFWKSYERLKGVMSMEAKELEE